MMEAANDHGLPSEAEVLRAMHDLLEGIAQIAENHGFARGDDLQVWLAKNATDAARYRYLRSRDLDTIDAGGIFAGLTPENAILNGDTLDDAIDVALAAEADGNKSS